MPMQFSNPANPEIHRRTTAEEIWGDLDGRVDAFVAGVGNRRHDHGRRPGAKERRPDVQVIGVEPAGSPVISGGVRPTRSRGSAPGSCPRCSTAR